MQTKLCPRCKVEKGHEEFYKFKDGRLKSWCKSCVKASIKSWMVRNRERSNSYRAKWARENYPRHLVYARRSQLKRYAAKCGTTIEWYEATLAEQKGRCAICRTAEMLNKGCYGAQRLSIDHDHTTGEVRGLLCNNCNRALGLIGDNAKLLSRAVKYLKGFAV